MRKYILAALAAGSFAGSFAAPAMAQTAGDNPTSYTGVKVEGLVGYDRLKVPGDHSNGVLYGAGVGYDAQMGGLVLGVEGEASGSTTDQCATSVNVTGDRLCAKLGRDLYVGGRIGAVVGGRTLLYAKGGYTNARVRLTYADGGTGVNNFNLGTNKDGWRVGGGVEQSVGSRTFVKAEYRYSTYSGNIDKHQVLAGFGVRF
jgi:outer membrane immunogenic protein